MTQSRTGVFSYTARRQPKGATASAVGAVTAGGIASVHVLTTDLVIAADNRTEAVLKVELRDANGNRLTAPPYQVKFVTDATLGLIRPLTNDTVTTVSGVAQLRVTAGQVVGQQAFQVIAANPATPLVPALPPVSVTVTTRGVAQRLELRYGDNNRNALSDDGDIVGRAGVPFLVDVVVLDENGDDVTFERGRSVKLTLLDLETGLVAATLNGPAVYGRATFAANLTTSPGVTAAASTTSTPPLSRATTPT